MIPMEKENQRTERLRKAFFILFWLIVWELADHLIQNRLILSGPIRVLGALAVQVRQSTFWITCLTSFLHIAEGFLLSFVCGFLLAVLAHRVRLFREFLAPVIALLKTVPMVAFVIMLLIWVGNQALTIYLSFLIVFPMVYTSTLSGLESVSRETLEMAEIYQIRGLRRFLYIYRPAFMPYIISSCKVSLGMSWKSGIMAEVIGTPEPSIGREMFQAKSYLMTADLFAWTIVVIILSLIFEKVFLMILQRLSRPVIGRV